MTAQPPVPQAVLDAAMKAAMQGVLSQHGLRLTEDQVWPVVWIALTDAAPHIAAEAVAAERERCAQLAETHRASYLVWNTDLDPVSTRKPFAALLRQDPEQAPGGAS